MLNVVFLSATLMMLVSVVLVNASSAQTWLLNAKTLLATSMNAVKIVPALVLLPTHVLVSECN
jgi:hypothetical protein